MGFREYLVGTPSMAVLALTPHQAFADEAEASRNEIVVSATGYALNIQDAPASISVITADEIKERSYTDITDVLQNVPGIHIQGGGVEQSIMVRGMSAEYTLFLVDGRRMQDEQAFARNGALQGSQINFLPPLESIERIEVIRGPASSLYGSDAIGGVINIITKKVMNDFSGSFSTEYIKAGPGNDVTNDGLNASLALNIPILKDRLSLQLTGGLRLQDESDFVGGGDAAAADPEFKRRNIAAKLNFRLDDANSFTAGAGTTVQERSHTPGKSLAPTANASYSKSIRDNYFITHDGDYGKLIWNSYLTYDASSNPTRVNATTGIGITFDTLVFNSQAALDLNRHKVVFGVNYRNEKLQDGATNGINIPGFVVPTDVITMERNLYAVFVEDNWEILDDLTLLLSGRYDHSATFGGKFSPKAYAVYKASDSLTLKGGITTGYKVPSLRDAATDFGSTSMGGVIIGNPDLKPESTTNYEIGVAYQSRSLGLSTGVTAYKSKFKDKLLRTGRICLQNVECVIDGVTYPAHQYGYTTKTNVDSAELQGVEWTLDWGITKNLQYRHSYTYAESEQTSGTYKGSPLNDIPEHMFNASLDWKATEQLNIWGQLNYRGKSSGRAVAASGSGTNGIQYPPYTFYNLGLGYEATKDIRLNLGVYNLTNKKVVPEDGFAYVLDGRRFSAGVNVTF